VAAQVAAQVAWRAVVVRGVEGMEVVGVAVTGTEKTAKAASRAAEDWAVVSTAETTEERKVVPKEGVHLGSEGYTDLGRSQIL